MTRISRKPAPPKHWNTGLPGVTYFEERGSSHEYRVLHADWYCFCLVLGGEGDVRYRNRTLRLTANQAFVFAPGEVHETRRIYAPGTYRVLMIPAATLLAHAQLRGQDDLQLPITLANNHPAFAELLDFTDQIKQNDLTSLERDVRYAALLETLVSFDERETGSNLQRPGHATPRVVTAVREYLWNNDNPDLKLPDVARALGWSAGYVSRVFSEHGYCPPKTLLRLLRVERARRQMVDSSEYIKRAALEAGFKAPEKFNEAFRAAWNMTPTEYRQKHRLD